MSSFWKIILILSSLLIIGGDGEKPICLENINADPYAEKILLKVADIIDEPIRLPDYYKGRLLDLYNGTLMGVRSLHRSGHSVVTCEKDALYHEIPIAITDVFAEYRWQLHFLNWKKHGSVFVKGIFLKATAVIKQELKRGVKPVVHKFVIDNVSKPSVKFTGISSFIQGLVGNISTIVVRSIPKLIYNALEKPLHAALEKAINEIFSVNPRNSYK